MKSFYSEKLSKSKTFNTSISVQWGRQKAFLCAATASHFQEKKHICIESTCAIQGEKNSYERLQHLKQFTLINHKRGQTVEVITQ